MRLWNAENLHSTYAVLLLLLVVVLVLCPAVPFLLHSLPFPSRLRRRGRKCSNLSSAQQQGRCTSSRGGSTVIAV
jgi:hypothetical protein